MWQVPARVVVASLNQAALVAELVRLPEFAIEKSKLRRILDEANDESAKLTRASTSKPHNNQLRHACHTCI